MKVSVVIPLYNKAAYIRRTIESVFAQQTPADEIVVIDDGSTDGSAEEILKITDPRLRLIRQANAGECTARNRGVAESKNDLVAFLDADDEWKPDFLTHIQRLVNNFPDCGAYATSYEVIIPGVGSRAIELFEIPPAPWIGILPNLFKLSQVTLPLSSSSIAIPKPIFQDLGGFPAGVTRGGDLMMWIRLGLKYPIAYSPSCQVIYHTEAANRACVIFPSLGEPASATLIARMLENGEVPQALVGVLQDYYASEQISKAQELIKTGHARMARELLGKARHNRRHRPKWIWWYFWALMPQALVNFITRLRSGTAARQGDQ